MKVRGCCIDEISLAFNVLSNHGLAMATSRQNHNKTVMFYESKNTPTKNVFCGIPFWCNLYQKSFYSIRSFLWSLTISTRTRPRSFVTIECDWGSLYICFPKFSFSPYEICLLFCHKIVNIWFKRTVLWWKHDGIQWRTRRYAHLWHPELSCKNCNFTPQFWGVFTAKIFLGMERLWMDHRRAF